MIGAAIGDIVGSRFEWERIKTKEFDFFHPLCKFTDDTVCTSAVADILLHESDAAATMQKWCREYPGRGYGGMFAEWIEQNPPQPYGSFGNGAAMRVSPAAILNSGDLSAALRDAGKVTEITHNAEEGIKGAKATTHAIWLALNGESPETIRDAVQSEYGYDLSRTVDEIRPGHTFTTTCQISVPAGIVCALESSDYEDAIRNAVSLGEDTDTEAAIAGGIAEAMHGVPKFILKEGEKYLDEKLADIFYKIYDRAEIPFGCAKD